MKGHSKRTDLTGDLKTDDSASRRGGRIALVALALVSLALTFSTLSGCGEDSLQAPSRTSVTALQTDTTTGQGAAEMRTATWQALHERVMAEQGRDSSTRNSRRVTTTINTTEEAAAAISHDSDQASTQTTTSVVLTDGLTPLKGVWSGTAEQLASFLLKTAPSPRFTVPASVLAEYYVYYCGQADLRADLLWAQMIHETGCGMYGGDVEPDQNNFAGLGATGDGVGGFAFVTAESGVMAQIAHMVAYVYPSSPVAWADISVDPRFDMVNPRGVVSVLADLDGRWAVPGIGYGQRIEDIARAINASASGQH